MQMKPPRFSKVYAPGILLLAAMALLPLNHLNYFELMPGDIGDARLNNYFLEHVYQFFLGTSTSLWEMPFFYPFPYVLGFSDNLFGSAPVYLAARFLGAHTDTAFQIWFLVAYISNFSAAYYALRALGCSAFAASMGALIFAFSLPTTAHTGHAQLHYRFGIPLAILFFAKFLEKNNWHAFMLSGVWLVWQFYAGIYMGFFTLLLLSGMLITYVGREKFNSSRTIKTVLYGFVTAWQSLLQKEKSQNLILLFVLLGLLLILFFPYWEVSRLYGAKREWAEISTMLPRPQSYFLADALAFWPSSRLEIFGDIPMRHEHQMFMGVTPLLLVIFGVYAGIRSNTGKVFPMMLGSLGIAIISTLYIGGFSIWYFLHKLPLASAIRAITRLDQAILFPIAYIAALGIDHLRARRAWWEKPIVVLILPILLFEMSMTAMSTSPKQIWRQRISEAEQILPKDMPEDAIIFIAQKTEPFYAAELDAMWVAINHRVKTLNGYSGLLPPGYTLKYGKNCAEWPHRVAAYVGFAKSPEPDTAYQKIMSQTIPLGFEGCEAK